MDTLRKQTQTLEDIAMIMRDPINVRKSLILGRHVQFPDQVEIIGNERELLVTGSPTSRVPQINSIDLFYDQIPEADGPHYKIRLVPREKEFEKYMPSSSL